MQFEAVGIMNEAIEDGVGQGRLADDIVPERRLGAAGFGGIVNLIGICLA
jgi:hypothetical protein